MAEERRIIGGNAFVGQALGTILAYQDRLNVFTSTIGELYADTFAREYNNARQVRRVLEKILWETEDAPVREAFTRQEWVKGIRIAGEKLYLAREIARKADKENAVCDGSEGFGCSLPNPENCAVHGPLMSRLQAVLKAYRAHGEYPGNDAVPEPDRAEAPNGGDGIVIPMPGAVAEAMGFHAVPDGSGGAVFYRR